MDGGSSVLHRSDVEVRAPVAVSCRSVIGASLRLLATNRAALEFPNLLVMRRQRSGVVMGEVAPAHVVLLRKCFETWGGITVTERDLLRHIGPR